MGMVKLTDNYCSLKSLHEGEYPPIRRSLMPLINEGSSFEEVTDTRLEQQEQKIRELQAQLEEAGKQQSAFEVVSRSKFQKAFSSTEDRMMEHLASSSHEEELTSLLADLTNLDEFHSGVDGELLAPENFLQDLKDKVVKEKPTEVERFVQLQSMVLAKIQDRKVKNV